jgi:hypothetical protein
MKKLFFTLVAVIFTVPVWADDINPVSVDQAIEQYKSFWSSNAIDPSNHEVWKLYIRKGLIPKGNQNGEVEYYSTVLTLSPKPRYVVEISVNQLFNFLQPVPKVGDIIAVEGRITNHFMANITGRTKVRQVKTLVMYIENAQKLPSEPTPVPNASATESDEDSESSVSPATTPAVSSGTAPVTTNSTSSTAVAPVMVVPGSSTPVIPGH